MSARNMAKRTAAGTLALAVCLGGGALALAGAAQADANFKFDARIAGDTRYGTAIAASKAAFPDGTKTDNVVLVNGFATVDGLTASYLAGVANAPILYVSDQGADADTKAEIKRLGAKNVWLVGGTTVIPAGVEAAIKGDGYNVTRINGSDRYETAKLIAEAGAKIAGKQPSKVFVASGTSFADALAVSPIAYAKGYAIALTDKDSTSDFTKKELGNIGTDNKVLVGGTAVVSDKVKADLSITNRISGDDRAVTANLVSDWAKSTEGFSKANAALVGGTNGNGADSLVAASVLGKSSTTLHFAGWDATSVYLKDHSAELSGKSFVFGGSAAVTGDQVSKANTAVQTVVSNQTFKATGGGLKTVSTAATGLTNQGAIGYSFTGLDDSKSYTIALWDASTVSKAADGSTVFSSAGQIGTGVGASIETINGAVGAVAASSNNMTISGSTKSVNGAINISVDSIQSTTSVVPVIWDNSDGTVTAPVFTKNGTPTTTKPLTITEAFGVGAASQWNAVAATTANYTGSGATSAPGALTILSIDTKAKTIQATYNVSTVAQYATFSYGAAGSTFTYTDGSLMSADTFASSLSIAIAAAGGNPSVLADTLTVNYSATGPSAFTMSTDVPSAPSGVTATYMAAVTTGAASNQHPAGVLVKWAPAANTNIASYAVKFAVYDATTGKLGNFGSVANLTSGSDLTNTTGVTSVASTEKSAFVPIGANSTLSGAKAVFEVVANNGSVFGAPSSQSADLTVGAAATATVSGVISTSTTYQQSAANATNTVTSVAAGDTISVNFNKPVSVSSGWSLQLANANRTNEVLLNANNSTATVAANGYQMIITVGTVGSTTPALTWVKGNALALGAGNYAQVTSVAGVSGTGTGTPAWNLSASGVATASSLNITGLASATRTVVLNATATTTTTNTNGATGFAGAVVISGNDSSSASSPNTIAITSGDASSFNAKYLNTYDASGALIDSVVLATGTTSYTPTSGVVYKAGATYLVTVSSSAAPVYTSIETKATAVLAG